MKTKLSLIPIAAILAGFMFAFQAQADSRTVDVLPFTKIKVSTGLRVVYVEGPLKPVSITATSNHINNIIVENEDETLVVSYSKKGGSINIDQSDIEIVVTAPKVRSFKVSSGAIIYVEQNLERDSATINAASSSGGKIKFKNITAATINLSTSSGAKISAGNINLSSTGNINASSGAKIIAEAINLATGNINASSSANVKIASLKANSLNIRSNATSKVTINYVQTPIANVVASSSSKIILLGNIENKLFETNSSARIEYDDID